MRTSRPYSSLDPEAAPPDSAADDIGAPVMDFVHVTDRSWITLERHLRSPAVAPFDPVVGDRDRSGVRPYAGRSDRVAPRIEALPVGRLNKEGAFVMDVVILPWLS